MIIRPAIEADIPALIAIGHKFFAVSPYRHFSSMDEPSLVVTLRNLMEHHSLVVGEVDGSVVSAAGAMIAPCYWNHADLQALEFFWWVDPEHRRDGNGRRLRQALEQEVRTLGVKFWCMVALEECEPEKVGAMYRRGGLRLVEHTYMKVL